MMEQRMFFSSAKFPEQHENLIGVEVVFTQFSEQLSELFPAVFPTLSLAKSTT
jgi:hypothetical protein